MGIEERKQREKQMRKQQIQDAAVQVFRQKGVTSSTIEDIATQAELSPATIYLYFKNKYELYASLNLKYMEMLQQKFEKVYNNQNLTLIEKIHGFKEAMYNTFCTYPYILNVIFHVQLNDVLINLDKELLDELNKVGRSFMNLMALVYEEGVAKEQFQKGHPMAHADILWSIFSGLVVWEEAKKQIDPRKDFLKSTLDRAFDIFCWGIKKHNDNTT